MGLAVAESTQQPAETFNSKPCTSTLKGISLLLTVTSLNEPEVAKLGPPEVLTTESLLSLKKENMNFNYCSELTVRVLIPLQWKELALKRVPEAWRCSQALEKRGCGFPEPGGHSSVPVAPARPWPLTDASWHLPAGQPRAATSKPPARGTGCRQTQASYATSLQRPLAFSSREIKWCWLANACRLGLGDRSSDGVTGVVSPQGTVPAVR